MAVTVLVVVGCGPSGDTGPVRTVIAEESVPRRQAAAAWANWRGPGGRSTVRDAELPARWPEDGLQLVWQQPMGTGWSSPVVADGRLVVTDRQGPEERVLCLNSATGEIVWQQAHAVDFDPHPVGRRHGNGPKSTAVIDGSHVLALGIAGWLECLDAATGERRWRVNFPAAYGDREPLPGGRAYVKGTECVVVPVGSGEGGAVPLFGYTGSLLVDDGRVISSVGGPRAGTLMAFDVETGDEVWRALDEHVSYSSPTVADIAGVRQIVAMTGPRVVGLEAESGKLLWSHPFQIQYDESISTPTVAGDLVLVTGDSRPLTALRIERADDGSFSKSVAWTNRDLSSYLSSMVVAGEYVYGMNDGGEFACIRLADGVTTWVDGAHGYYCSPVRAGELLLGLNDEGALAVLEATPAAYAPVANVSLVDEPTWTMPAVVTDSIVVRSAAEVRCFRLAP